MLNKSILIASARPLIVAPAPVLASWSLARTTGGNVFSLAVPEPTGLTEGELLLLGLALDRGGDGGVSTITNPSSMTTVQDQNAGGGFVQGRLIGRIATASEPSSYTFSWTTVDGLVGQEAVAFALRITGAASTFANAINVSAQANSGTATASPPSPSVTTTENNCLVLRLCLGDSDTDFADDSRSPPSGTTSIFNRRSSTLAGFGPAQAHLATEVLATAGAAGGKSFDFVAADQYVSITAAISSV